MNAQTAMPESASALSAEDRARADFYALIARLFYAGPDADLLAALAGADEISSEAEDQSLVLAWKALTSVAAAADAEAAQSEYDNVFVGTGKTEISPYASSYLSDSMKENVLVRLRAELAGLGLARAQGAAEYEDHISGLCEIMRHLIFLAGDVAVQKQKNVFMDYISNCYAGFCTTVVESPNTNFYKHVARFTQSFLDVEKGSFEIAR